MPLNATCWQVRGGAGIQARDSTAECSSWAGRAARMHVAGHGWGTVVLIGQWRQAVAVVLAVRPNGPLCVPERAILANLHLPDVPI